MRARGGGEVFDAILVLFSFFGVGGCAVFVEVGAGVFPAFVADFLVFFLVFFFAETLRTLFIVSNDECACVSIIFTYLQPTSLVLLLVTVPTLNAFTPFTPFTIPLTCTPIKPTL